MTRARAEQQALRWAKVLNFPLEKWPGQCSGVSASLLEAKLIRDGRLVRGLWVGPVAVGSIFHGRPISGHTWIERSDGTIVDPTRWAFEMVTPYIFHGLYDRNYDKGGNRFRGAFNGACPAHDASTVEVTLTCASVEAATCIRELLPPDSLADEESPDVLCNAAQVHWLANCAPARLGIYAREIFEAIVAAGYRARIPIDNQREVLGR